MEAYTASLRGLFYEQLHGKVGTVPCTSIEVHERQRKIDRKVVDELSESIEQTGLLQPVGIRYTNKGEAGAYHLVYGAHRFAAWLEKFKKAQDANDEEGMRRWHSMPAVVFGAGRNMSDDMMLLLELTENVNRKDLSSSERKRMASQAGKLALKLDSKNPPKGKTLQPSIGVFKPPAMKSIAEVSGIPYSTFEKWFSAYRKSISGPSWTKQTEPQYKAWLDHLEAEGEREKAAAAQAEKDKKDSSKEKSLKNVIKALSDHAGLYGVEGLMACVKKVITEYK